MIYYPIIKENNKCFIENNINSQFENLFPIEYCIINYTSESFSNSPINNIYSISPITNNIYLSGIFGANNLNKLKEYNITYIIIVQNINYRILKI